MADYPTLSVNHSSEKDRPEDSTIKSDHEAGYLQTRSRHTRERMSFDLTYELISDTDKATLKAFATSVQGGTTSFNWTDPLTSTVYVVRFDKTPEFDFVAYGWWETSFTLLEV